MIADVEQIRPTDDCRLFTVVVVGRLVMLPIGSKIPCALRERCDGQQ